MKSSLTSFDFVALLLALACLLSVINAQGNERGKTSSLRRRLSQSEECILTWVDVQMEDNTSAGRWECELQQSDVDETGLSFVAVKGVPRSELNAEATSGETTMFADGAVIDNGQIVVPKSEEPVFGEVSGATRRKLAPGDVTVRKVLVVRVVASDRVTTADPATLSGDIFGTGKDASAINMRERFMSCSYGEVQMTPYTGQFSGVAIQDGVVQVQIGSSVNMVPSTTVRNNVLAALASTLGIAQSSIPRTFDHVMLCLPFGTTGPVVTSQAWIAFGTLNSWLTVYNDNWCRYTSTPVHELGHNLGLNHAGEGADNYGDQTGFMGYSYAVFNQRMCFNTPQHWQLGWYSQKRDILDFSSRGGFFGSLVGINDYQNGAAAGRYVMLLIRGSGGDLFLGFNRNTGINANTQEGFNQVTVHNQRPGNGLSFLLAKLSAGGTYIASQFLNGNSLIITVNTISLSSDPAYADVTVYMDGCPPGVCGAQCNSPCPPTPAPVEPPTPQPVEPPTPQPVAPPPPPPVEPPTPQPVAPPPPPPVEPPTPQPVAPPPPPPVEPPTPQPVEPVAPPPPPPVEPPTPQPVEPVAPPPPPPVEPPTPQPVEPVAPPPPPPVEPPTPQPVAPPPPPPVEPPTPQPVAPPVEPPTPQPVAPPPTPAPLSVFTNFFLETFENGLGVFLTNNAKSSNKVFNSALGSRRSIEMRSSGTQIVTSGAYSVAIYQQIQIKLWCYMTKGVSGDSIIVDVSTNNGATWENAGRLSRDTDFSTDKVWFERGLIWNKPAGVESLRLRITTATTARKSKGKLYLENVGMDGI